MAVSSAVILTQPRVPGPFALPPFGQLLSFHRDSVGFLSRLARRYGDVSAFRLGRHPAFLFTHPEHVRTILIADPTRFGRGRLMQKAKSILGEGLLTSEGELHRRERRLVLASLARERAARYAGFLPGILDRMQGAWSRSDPIDLVPAMNAIALESVSAALFGEGLGDEGRRLRLDLEYVNRWAPLLLSPGIGRIPMGPMRKARLALARLHRAVTERAARASGSGSDGTIVDFLADRGATEERGCPALVRDQAMAIFLAGHDTTAAALGWIWHLIGRHSEVESALHAELDRVLGSRDPGLDHLPQLELTGQVVAEALRLFPPVSRIGRRPYDDYAIGDHVVPRGSTIFLSPYVTQRDERWFPRPDQFEPTRWASDAGRNRWAYFPFGAGSHACVGEHLARLTLGLTVATVARRWRFRLLEARPPVSRFLTLKLKRLLVKVEKRQATSDRPPAR